MFPIPESASIAEFAIWDGDRRLVGEVRSREEARRIYDEIVRRQRDPGLLEYAGKDLFQASIFPILPHSDKKLEITYTQVVRAEGGTVSYRYPLGTGRQLAQIGSVAGRVEVESKEPLRNVYSPTHSIDVKRSNDRRSVVSFESESGKEPQDFQLFYTISKEDFGLTLLTHREAGKHGYFLLMISPKDDWSEQEYSAKDVVFVVDTSGSMAEEGKMEKARAALLYGVRILRPQDRFNIISFAGEEHLMEAGLILADDKGRARGEAFVKALEAGRWNKHQPVVTGVAASIQRKRSRASEDARVHDGRSADSRRNERFEDRRQRAQGWQAGRAGCLRLESVTTSTRRCSTNSRRRMAALQTTLSRRKIWKLKFRISSRRLIIRC